MSVNSKLHLKTLLNSTEETTGTGSQKLLSLFLFLVLSLFFSVFNSGCGGNVVHSGFGRPPLDTTQGEGNLVSSQLVMTYPTADTPTQAGLETFYTNLICPSGPTYSNCKTNEASLNTAEFGNFNLADNPISSNPLGIKMVDAIKIDYTAINVDHTAVQVSGGMLVPEVASSSIKGVILYFHGTTVQRNNVPSDFTTTTNTSFYTDGAVLAAVWASQGYVVVMPDYIGLGDDTTHPHPYVVYPAENAQSGLAMVSAARSLLSKNYNITGILPMYITGYSEGGAYSLEAGHLMQDNSGYASQLKVQLQKVVPLSGFFDLSGTGLSYLFDNISNTNNQWYSPDPVTSALSKPFLSAYLILSFANYSGISPTDMLASKFYYGSCSPDDTNCSNLNDTYFTNTQLPLYDTLVLGIADTQAAGTGWSTQQTNYSNAITPLLTPAYANALMQKDSSNPLYRQVARADTYRFVPKFPLTIVSLQQDSVVTRMNSDVAYAYLQKQNPKGPYQEVLVPNSDFLDYYGAPIDHLTELPFLSVLILNQFNTPNPSM